MILVSIIFLVAIGCLQGAQEAPDLPLAVAPTGTGLAHLGGHVGAQNQLPMHFLAQDHLWVSVLFCYLPVGVISNHPTPQSPSNPMCWENLTRGQLISTFWSKWVGLNPLLSVNLIFGYFQFNVLVLQHSSTSIDSIKGSNAGCRAGIV